MMQQALYELGTKIGQARTEMPAMDRAVEVLQKLRKELGLKVHVFSHRPWPVPTNTSTDVRAWSSELTRFRRTNNILGSKKSLRQSLQSLSFETTETFVLSLRHEYEFQLRSVKDRVLAICRRLYVRLPWIHFIDRITHIWMYKHGLQYDRLVIEKGHTNLVSPNARFVNRFNIARRNSLRFFVEDDLEKAEKLAHICNVVF